MSSESHHISSADFVDSNYNLPPPPPPPPPPGMRPSPSIVCNTLGDRYMVAVDPLTRKLMIPYDKVFETLAQYRTSVPSLCQLFLNGRCRQGANCHQVHADPVTVFCLRQQVERLPLCCVLHGDTDHTGGAADPRAIHIHQLQWNDGVVPINRLSKTAGLQKVLENNLPLSEAHRNILVASGTHSSICRLHVMDRCRFAEDCKFLHICKEVVMNEPNFFSEIPSSNNSNMNNSRFTNAAPSYAHTPPQSPYRSATLPLYSSITALEPPTPLERSANKTPPSPMMTPSNSTPGRSIRSTNSGNMYVHEPYLWAALPPVEVA